MFVSKKKKKFKANALLGGAKKNNDQPAPDPIPPFIPML